MTSEVEKIVNLSIKEKFIYSVFSFKPEKKNQNGL